MKTLHTVRVFASACALVGACFAPARADCSAHLLPNQTRSEATIQRLDKAWGAAWQSADIPFLACLYDDQWHYVTPSGITDKAHDLAQSERRAQARKKSGKQSMSHTMATKAFVNGNFGAVTGIYEYSSKGKTVQARWTDFFMWDGSRWHAVFSQATPIPAS